ncbi:hypothetical protein RJ55_00057 [Drechmeria coniospora]|nr:hypothetical protein RJ55_00057 [Drechmeria coniospora]
MLLPFPSLCIAVATGMLLVHLTRCLRSPLRKVPGPTASLFTSFVLKWNELNAQRTSYVHQLHKKHGPVVRLAPNEVSFTSWPALKEIYCSGGSGYDKSAFYDLFQVYGRRTMFTRLNKTDHARRRRILADRYTNTNVMHHDSIQGIQERSYAFVQRCTSASGTKTSDVFASFDMVPYPRDERLTFEQMALHSYACDCVTRHLFHPNGTDCLGKKSDEDMMHQVVDDDSMQNRLISHYFPTLHKLLARVLAVFVKPREVPLADNYVLETSRRTDASNFTLRCRMEGKADELDSVDMAAECLDHMVAGIDTTGDTLCFLMWELSQPRSQPYQRRLMEELRQARGRSIEQLPFLDAVLCEGLRCYPAIPMSLPRLVPRGGRIIDGYSLPEDTIVSCQALSVHQINQDVFPDPETFNPDRWLAPDGDIDRRRLLFSFANGGRGCVGKHLAMAEMKTLLRDVYSKFTTTPDPAMEEASMVMDDQLISTRPRGKSCLLQFHPVERSEDSRLVGTRPNLAARD